MIRNYSKCIALAASSYIIGYATEFFIYEKGSFLSIFYYFVIGTCAFLIYLVSKPNFLTGMNIENMNLERAMHYFTTVLNIIIGFSAIIGIGITLMWTNSGVIWRLNISYILIALSIFFVGEMYLLYLGRLRDQIVIAHN
jgi:hypothetical protein